MIEQWKHSDNMWLRRVCIIHQLGYKEATDLDMLTEMVFINASSNEFFIQKAIGWALRQYAKTDPEWVLRFVDVNPLKNLSKREAVKNIKGQ
jgi:3-methyladenine DNA glycosylase AlkD